MLKISDDEAQEIVESCAERELSAAWIIVEDLFDSFKDRRAAFLWVLQKLLESGRFRLKNRITQQPLEGSIQELVKLFDAAMPKTGEEIDAPILSDPQKYVNWLEEAGRGVLMQHWFFDEECPGDPSWLIQVSEGVCEWS